MTELLARLTNKDPAASHDFDPDDVLPGMSPRLVIDLARLAGASLHDLSVTLHLMPFGDRAVMAAYGLIEMGEPDASGRRSLRVDPFCLEVIAAAAELVASVVNPAAVAARLQEVVDAGPAEQVRYIPVTSLAEQAGEGKTAVEGVVCGTELVGAGLVRLDVALTEPVESAAGGHVVRFLTDNEPSFRTDAAVSLAYPAAPESPLSVAQLTAEH